MNDESFKEPITTIRRRVWASTTLGRKSPMR